jgi:hypothetical protein
MEQWPVRVPNVGPWRWQGRGWGDRLLGNGDEIRRRPLAAAVIRLHGPAFHSNGAAGGRHLLLLDPHPSNFFLVFLLFILAPPPSFSWINGRYYRLSHRSVEIQIRDFESLQILSLQI